MSNPTLFGNKNFPPVSSFRIFLILCLLGLIAYGHALSYPFVHDDRGFIVENPQINQWGNLSSYFLQPSKLFQVSPISSSYYRPLLDILYKIEYFLFGKNPAGYHLVNIIIHIFNSFFIYRIFCYILKRSLVPFILAVIFLIHPVKSGSVVIIVGISDLTYSFFCLLSFWLYVKKRYTFSLLAFLFAIFAKEQAIILPFLICVYEIYLERTSHSLLKKGFLRLSGFFLILIAYVIFRKTILGVSLPLLGDNMTELTLRLQSIPAVLLMNIKVLLFPFDIHFFRVTDILMPAALHSWILLLVCILAAILIWKLPAQEKQAGLFGLGWFLILLLPTLNLVPLFMEYSYIWTPEHFLYLPMAGFFLFVILAMKHILIKLRFREKKIAFFLILVLGCYLAITWKQNSYFQSEIKLLQRAVDYEPRFGRLRAWLGNAYVGAGQFDRAIAEYQKALQIMISYENKTNGPAREFYIQFVKELQIKIAACGQSKK